jgi:hypothetical protein
MEQDKSPPIMMKSKMFFFIHFFILMVILDILKYNYIASVFHWNVTIWLAMKWSNDYKSDVSHPNETQIRTCTCLHDDVRCKQSMA